jgi:hypothetical protein
MTTQTTALSKVAPYFSLLEKIFLAGLVVGLVLIFLNPANGAVIKVSLVGLAITYFLTAFKPIDIPVQADERFEFKDLLTLTILPKVMWISCAISLFGILIYTLQLPHDGHKRLLMTGGSTIVVGLIILDYAALTETKHLKYILPIALRAAPLVVMDFYLLYK